MKKQMNNTPSICDDGVTKEEVGQMASLNKTTIEEIEYANGKVNKLVIISNGKTVTYTGSDVTIGDTAYVCKRATTLHTEECTQTDTNYYCSGVGYTAGGIKGTSTITYGNLGEKGTLAPGDAFDCDVNGDGNYDAALERFYYVASLDSNIASLIYYTNVSNGEPTDPINYAYNTDTTPYLGPQTAIEQLPTTSQWSNVNLTSATRNIKDEIGTDRVSNFDYTGRAARLLTTEEIKTYIGTIGNKTVGELDNYLYLVENMNFAKDSIARAYWLENPISSNGSEAWDLGGSDRLIDDYSVADTAWHGVRPVIEVPKNKINYN